MGLKIGTKQITAEQYRQGLKKIPAKNKYGAKPMETGGKKYASTKEGLYIQGLELKKKLPDGHPDKVTHYETQIRYSLAVGGVHICDYILDALVYYANRPAEYIDVKGYKKGLAYRHFRVKANLMQAVHGITVIEK